MNTIESHVISNPSGLDDECAKLVIDEIIIPFVMTNVTTPESEYTFSFWIKSDYDGSVSVAGQTFTTTPEWSKYFTTFIADASDLQLIFNTIGSYYIYHPQLEVGNIVTDWTPAPEDMATNADIADLNNDIQETSKNFSEFVQNANEIYATVSSVDTKIEENAKELNDSITEVSKQVSTMMTSSEIKAEIATQINNGVNTVTTTTGYTFDADGLTIDKSDAKTKTTVSSNGMVVSIKRGNNSTPILTANDKGVIAEDLSASTYLIIGGRSRFENFGNNRTGCFWIGG